jgi:hypothetical protein
VLKPSHLHFQLTFYYEPVTKLYFLNNIGVVRGDHKHIHSITNHALLYTDKHIHFQRLGLCCSVVWEEAETLSVREGEAETIGLSR